MTVVQPAFDSLPVFLRCWVERQMPTSERRRKRRGRLQFHTVLVVDTETYTDLGQHLLFGSYRVLRKQPGTGLGVIPPAFDCVEEGLFYDPDAPPGGPPGLDVLRDIATRERAEVRMGVPTKLRLRTLAEFCKAVVFPVAFDAYGLVVGFNLPFDLSRLATDWTSARSGGISLTLSEWADRPNRYKPRIVIKHIDSKRAFTHFTKPKQQKSFWELVGVGRPRRGRSYQGRFLDLRTLSFALSDRADSLNSAAKHWGMTLTKGQIEHTGRITHEYVEYNRQDVRLTCRLLCALLAELHRHPVDIAAIDAWSPASMGKAYLRTMGVQPRLDVQPSFPTEAIAHAMHAYYGGRAECMIRRVPIPVVYVDFTSMYPTVCANMRLWDLMTCATIEVVDATDDVRTWLETVTADDLFDRAAWPRLVGFVELVPDGDMLPVRAEFAEGAPPNIAVAPVTATRSMWYTIADVVALALPTGRPPGRIVSAVRLVPQGAMPNLRPVKLRDTILCNPGSDDFFRLAIEERQRIRNDAERSNDEAPLSDFLKVLANSTSYGVWLEVNPSSTAREQAVTIHGLDGPVGANVSRLDKPGEYCFPPLAASITGAARLMLALLQHAVQEKGGCHAFCDTDSMAIVATADGGPVNCEASDGTDSIHALSWAEVDEIVGRFAALNPYDREVVPGSVLKIEDENYAKWGPRERKQLYCYAISAKRYALFNLDRRGRPVLRKSSEHGLGHLLAPPGTRGTGSWAKRAWLYMMRRDKDELAAGASWWRDIDLSWISEPGWLDRPALGRITITTPELARRFADFNATRDRDKRVRPFNFLLTAFIAPFGHPAGVDPEHFQLVTPFTTALHDPEHLRWTDRYTGMPYGVTTEINRPDQAQISTFRDHLNEYMARPEAKACGPSGDRCGRGTIGQLRPRPVTIARIQYIGKESNNLDDATAELAHDLSEIVTIYRTSDGWREYVVPVLRDVGVETLASLVPDIPTVSLADYLQGRSEPRRERRRRLLAAAVEHAGDYLRASGRQVPRHSESCCAAYLALTKEARVRRCACGAILLDPRARHCSAVCRQRSYRERQKRGTADEVAAPLPDSSATALTLALPRQRYLARALRELPLVRLPHTQEPTEHC